MVDLLSVSPSVVGLIARGHKNCTTQNFHTMKYTVVALVVVVDAGRRPLAMSQTKKKIRFPRVPPQSVLLEGKSSFSARKSEHNFIAFK